MLDPLLERASDEALARLEAAGGDLARLPIPVATVVVIYGVQGVIDNGGLRYFYEGDWPGNPPYSSFSDAYERIGATEAAACIAHSAAMFPFAQPERHKALRLAFLQDGATPEFFALDDGICGNRSIWKKLSAYVAEHRDEFRTPDS